MYQKVVLLILFLVITGPAQHGLAMGCGKVLKSPAAIKINSRLKDPRYKVLILGRHGKASEINKFTAKQRSEDPAKRDLDILRPLKKKGQRAAIRLAEMLAPLEFSNVWMWGSFAHRVIETANYTIEALGDSVAHTKFEEDLYYTDVPAEMYSRLTAHEDQGVSHAFFWGHGKSTLELFYKLTGADEAFLPTSAIMVVAVKADTWEEVFNGNPEHIEGFAWSPNDSHVIDGADVPISTLEGIAGVQPESAMESISSGDIESVSGSQGDDILESISSPAIDEEFVEVVIRRR